MKKLKLLLSALAAVSLIGLTGCSGTGPKPSAIITSKEGTTEEVLPIEDPETPETPEEPATPKIYEVSDLVSYFNNTAPEGISVSYIEEEDYWYLHYIVGESIDESMENLYSGISYFLDFIPIYSKVEGGYIFRYRSKYIIDPEIYFVYVGVSSNHFAAVSIYSYIEFDNLTVDVIIYDGRQGLYV